MLIKPKWLLDCEPRPVQLEATLRSFYGVKTMDDKNDTPVEVVLRDGPAKKWGHFVEMRLGKTPIALNEWLLFEQEHGVNRLVVITPSSYKYAWVNEFEHFGVPYPAVPLELKKAGKILAEVKNVSTPVALVVNYEVFQHDHGLAAVLEFMSGHPCGMVIDESIKIKNHESVQTRRCWHAIQEAAYVRPMTGKPITQGPQDLYMQLRACGALEGKVFHAFRNTYCTMGGYKGKKVLGVKNEEQLNSLVQSVSFLAKRKDWADVVDAQYTVDSLLLAPEQKKHYDTMEKEYYSMISDEVVIDVDLVITQWMKLQQIASGFIRDESKKVHWLLPPQKIPKVQRILQLMEETESKVVLFYAFNPSGEMLMEVLKGFNPCMIMGRQAMNKLNTNYEDEKLKFKNDPSCRIALMQLEAGKYGHDMTGPPDDRTSTAVYYENTVSLDTRIQTEARITTSQQDWPVLYLDMVSSEVEKSFIDALARKEAIETVILGRYKEVDRFK